MNRKSFMLIACITSCFIFLFPQINTSVHTFTVIYSILHIYNNAFIYPLYFFIGMLYFLFREKIKFKWSIFLLSLIVWVLSFKTIFFYFISMICLPYIILTIANTKIPYLNTVTKHGDLSYGIYISAFLIQQTIIHYKPNITVSNLIIASTIFSIVFASISWKYIESKALEMKKYDPITLVKLRISNLYKFGTWRLFCINFRYRVIRNEVVYVSYWSTLKKQVHSYYLIKIWKESCVYVFNNSDPLPEMKKEKNYHLIIVYLQWSFLDFRDILLE